MFLDTDIILAILKKEDWLKSHVNLSKIKQPKTTPLVIVEAKLIMQREFGRKEASSVLDKIKGKVHIEPFTPEMLAKGSELLGKYENLNIFDAFHAGACLILKEQILSTDHIFDEIEGLMHVDPRNLELKEK